MRRTVILKSKAASVELISHLCHSHDPQGEVLEPQHAGFGDEQVDGLNHFSDDHLKQEADVLQENRVVNRVLNWLQKPSFSWNTAASIFVPNRVEQEHAKEQ